MASLADDLKTKKNDLEDFRKITDRMLQNMADMIDETILHENYKLCSSTTAGTRKTIRPINSTLFIDNSNQFNHNFDTILNLFEKVTYFDYDFQQNETSLIDNVIYTIQQSIGIGFDLLVDSNSARKHVGNRFEELIRAIFHQLNIPLKKIILKIPYKTEDGEKFYKCETDVVISPFKSVKSSSDDIDPKEIVISLKTTTKDRMPKIFIDKILMEKFLGHPVRMIGISQNDVQRKEQKSPQISYTFVANLFMVYTKFLAELEGYYYLDLPKRATEVPFSDYIFPFSQLITVDLRKLLRA